MHDSSSTPSNAGDAGAAHAPVPSFSGAATGSPATTHDWTCPFCPLLCDDISIDLRGDNTLAASNTACPRLARIPVLAPLRKAGLRLLESLMVAGVEPAALGAAGAASVVESDRKP